jgi:hypothetical protein
MSTTVVSPGQGTWIAEVYRAGAVEGSGHGCEIVLKFEPDAQLKIALIQVVTSSIKNGKNYDAINIEYASKHPVLAGTKIKALAGRSTGVSHLDRDPASSNPIYGAPDLGKGAELKDTPAGDRSVTAPPAREIAYCLGEGASHEPAKLYDGPVYKNPRDGDCMCFETGALCIDGGLEGTWLGTVTWGWERRNGVIFTVPLVGCATPSREFVDSLKKWNDSKSTKDVASIPVPFP